MDPPESTPYRDLFNPWFTPRSAKRWVPFVRDVTTALLDAAGPTGKIDFIHDLLSPVPAILTAKMLGLPPADWRTYSDASHGVVAYPFGTEESNAAIGDYISMIVKADETAKDRRQFPRDDMISAIVAAEIDGAKVSDQRALEMVSLVIVGGNDTTTNLLAGALHWLWENPRERARLAADPSLMQPACEEFLRVFAPTQALARTCTRDVEISGRRLKAGDRVLMAFASANFDPEAFDDPEQVRLDRSPNRHTSFGLGRHRCSGSNLARMVFSVVVEEVLTRMPRYELDADGCQPYDNIGIVNGWARLPATFAPVDRWAATSTSGPRSRRDGAAVTGVDAAKIELLLRLAAVDVEAGRLPSAQVAVARGGELIAAKTFGEATQDTRYVLQSAGRPVVASAIWMLMSRGRLDISRTVASYVPEFGSNGKQDVTVEQVLTHVAGFALAPLGYPRCAPATTGWQRSPNGA